MPSNGYKCPHLSEQDPILKILDKYKDHPRIKLIKAKNSSKVFKFRQIDIEEVKKTFQSLDPKKAAQKDDINTKKSQSFLRKIIDLSVSSQMFLRFMKGACMIK